MNLLLNLFINLLSKYQRVRTNYSIFVDRKMIGMRIGFILLMILLVEGGINAQEKKAVKETVKPEGINLRSNSRQYSMVTRGNDHKRKDMRMQQMKRKVKSAKQLQKNKQLQKANLRSQQNTRNKKLVLQKKAQQKKMRKQQRMKAKKRKR